MEPAVFLVVVVAHKIGEEEDPGLGEEHHMKVEMMVLLAVIVVVVGTVAGTAAVVAVAGTVVHIVLADILVGRWVG